MRVREAAPWLAVLAVLMAGYLVWRLLWGFLFVRNDQYRIRTLDVVPGALTTREEVVRIADLKEGAPLFEKGAAEICACLQHLDRVDHVDVSMRLPDALRVAVVDRVPVARLGGRGQRNLYVDGDAATFVIPPEKYEHPEFLPVIENGNGVELIPMSARTDGENAGQRFADAPGTPTGPESRAARAVRFIRTFNGRFSDDYSSDPAAPGHPPFRLESLDVSDPLWLIVVSSRGTLLFPWLEMTDEDAMLDRLRKVAAVLDNPAAAGKSRFCVVRTFSGEIHVHARGY